MRFRKQVADLERDALETGRWKPGVVPSFPTGDKSERDGVQASD